MTDSSRAQQLLADPPADADVVVRAPGRANLIGEYTDVNEGWVLPVALELATVLAGRAGGDVLRLRSLDLPEEGTVEIDLATGRGPSSGWGRYATAVVEVLREQGRRVRGFDGVLASDVPIGAGLSSSAALEVAVALAVLDEPVDPLALAQLCQRAENVGVGVQSGLMDQLASTGSRAGTALLLDCRELTTDHVPLPEGLGVLVVDSAVSRDLSSSAYNERRAQCEQAAADLGVRSLRDATPEGLEERWSSMDDVVRRRARHVVSENARVLELADVLRSGDRGPLGGLLAASHRSLAEDFEVSTPELDQLVASAVATPGVVGSRMTGAGFGGCTVSLVEVDGAEQVRDEVCRRYAEASGRQPRAWVSTAADGASVR
ncbi:MAG: Galactokinase [uncultured Frankineae bacterium]|uniref:Galactokinase n=1 Tax=uncultured Frankineae bacterium TaxID=437475 RepID=A0A6J4M426_9ACTN|nr:MAG: Galactokinase [uncultured Frankineae bacterium]